jgi:hypothetical protein
MKDTLLSAFVIFFPLLGTALLFRRTIRAELRNLNK